MGTPLIRSGRLLTAVAFLLLLQPTRCGIPTVNPEAAEFPPSIKITHGITNQGYPFIFGGVGSSERESMEERARNYNVKLVFAAKDGSFVSGVTLAIATAKGAEIMSVATEGPWFYIQLPPGIYAVKATFKGETKEIKALSVTKEKKVQQSLIWDQLER
jgi:hypothetical protein